MTGLPCTSGLHRPQLPAAPALARPARGGAPAMPDGDPCSRRMAAPCGRQNAQRVQSAAAAEAAAASVPQPKQLHWLGCQPSGFIENNRAFLEEHRIRGYEAGPDQCTTVITIANLLQEVASNHAVGMWGRSEHGFATDPALSGKGLIFVMTRMQIQMDHYPKWGDLIELETWFQDAGKLAAQRDWVVRDKISGRTLGRATSTWVMINMHTRRLTKMPPEILEKSRAFKLLPARHAIPEEYTRAKLPDLDLPAEIVGPVTVARRSDMDMNGHTNNVTYLAWVMETVPLDVYNNCHLYQLEVDYKAECREGDLVESLAARVPLAEPLASNGAGPDALTFVHVLRRCEGDNCVELVRARTTWRAGKPAAA